MIKHFDDSWINNRIRAVVKSCKTLEQWSVAYRYFELAMLKIKPSGCGMAQNVRLGEWMIVKNRLSKTLWDKRKELR